MEKKSNQPGLIHACLLNGKGGAKFVSDNSWQKWKKKDGVLWLHMDYTVQEVKEWLLEESKIPGPVSIALVDADSRPRVSRAGNSLLLVLRGINHNPGAEPEDMVAIRFWIEEHRIISTRNRDLRSVNDTASMLIKGNGPVNSGDFLATICENMIRRMGETIDDTEEQIASIESQLLEEYDSMLRNELSDLRRQIITMRRFLSPQKEALHKLPATQCTWIDDPLRLRLAEASDRLIHHVEDLDAVRERAAIVQEEISGRTNEQVNRRMYMLSLVTVVFMPLTFLTGLLGVNLNGIPGAGSHLAFTVFVLCLSVLGFLELWFLRKNRWF